MHHPNAALTASVGPVNADYDIEFMLGDVAYRQILWRNCAQYVSVFAGARFAQLDQNFSQTGTFGGGQGGVVDTSTSIEFTGAGPMAGIDGARQIGTTRFSVYGRSLVAAITGGSLSVRRVHDTALKSAAIGLVVGGIAAILLWPFFDVS